MQRPKHSTHTCRAHQYSQPARPAVQNVIRKDGQQNRIWQHHQAQQGKQKQRGTNRGILHGKAEPFQKIPQRRAFLLVWLFHLNTHRQQRTDHRKKADAVQEKTPSLAHSDNGKPRDSRAHDARAVEN